MSATFNAEPPPASHKYVEFDEFIDFQLNKTRAGIRYTDLLTAMLLAAVVVGGYLLAFTVLDQWVIPGGFGLWARGLMLAALVLFLGGWIAWKVALPSLRRVTALFAAKQIEDTQPDLKSSLLTLVDLKRAGRRIPPHILAAMEKRAAVRLSDMDVEQAVDRRPLMRLSYVLFALVVAACLYTVLSPKSISASVWRALLPLSQAPVATRTRIVKVDPGTTEVLARAQLEVTADLAGEIPAHVHILVTTHDHSIVDEPVPLHDTNEGLNRFRGLLTGPNGRGLLQDFTYVVEAGDARSERFAVIVQQAPYATVEEVVYEYPRYMGLSRKTQSGGDIDAWEGTQVTLRAVTNMPTVAATILRHDTEDTSLKAEETPLRRIDDTHWEATWRLEFRGDGTYAHFYRIQVRTEEGKADPVPRLHSVRMRRDLPPEIKLLHPTGDIELPANAVVPFAYQASDPDFLLRSVRLHFEKGGQPLDAKTRHLYDAPPFQSRLSGRDAIDLRPFDLNAGDVLTFWLEAWDNMEPLGARVGNRSVTPRVNISITDPVAARENEQRQQAEERAAENALQAAEQAAQQGREEGDERPQTDAPQPGDEGDDPAAETTQPGASEERPASDPSQHSEAGGENAPPAGGGQTQRGGQQSSQGGTPDGQGTPDEAQQAEGGTSSGQPQTDREGQTGHSGASPQGENARQNNGRSSQGARNEGPPQPRPGEQASDDEALQKFFNKYRDEISQSRKDGDALADRGSGGSNDREGSESGPAGGDPSGSENGRDPDAGRTGDESDPNGRDAGDPSGRTPPRGESPSDRSTNPPNPDAERPRGPNSNNSNPRGANDPRGTAEQPSPGRNAPRNPADPMTGQGGQPGPQASQPNSNSSGENSDSTQGTPGERTDSGNSGTNPSQDSQQPGEGAGGEPSESDPNASPAGRPSEGRNNPDGQGGAEPGGGTPRPRNPAGDPMSPGDRGSDSPPTQTDRPPARSEGQPSGPDDSQPGEGRRDGQRSQQPSGGEQGSSQQSSEGTSGGQQSGPGERSSSPGNQSASDGESQGRPAPGAGQPQQSGGSPAGDKPGGDSQSGGPGGEASNADSPRSQGGEGQPDSPSEGSDNGDQPGGQSGGSEQQQGGKPEGGAAGSQSGQKGSGSEQSGQQGGEKGGEGEGSQGSGGEGESESGGSSGGESGGSSGSGAPGSGGRGGTGGQGTGSPSPSGSGAGADSSGRGADRADLDDKRRATELVLRRLEDDLQRGELSPEELQELGWTEDNLRDFMQRLDQKLSDTGDDSSPEAEARRRQFAEILRGIEYSSEGQQRSGGARTRPVETGFAVPRRPAPSEFRSAEEGYKQKLSRETTGE